MLFHFGSVVHSVKHLWGGVLLFQKAPLMGKFVESLLYCRSLYCLLIAHCSLLRCGATKKWNVAITDHESFSTRKHSVSQHGHHKFIGSLWKNMFRSYKTSLLSLTFLFPSRLRLSHQCPWLCPPTWRRVLPLSARCVWVGVQHPVQHSTWSCTQPSTMENLMMPRRWEMDLCVMCVLLGERRKIVHTCII